jgi:hypothetical protein
LLVGVVDCASAWFLLVAVIGVVGVAGVCWRAGLVAWFEFYAAFDVVGQFLFAFISFCAFLMFSAS